MRDRAIQQWQRLRSDRIGDGVLEVPSLATGMNTGYGPVRLALGENGEPRLLVPVDSAARLPVVGVGYALNIRLHGYLVHGRRQTFIDLTCQDPALETVFAELADEIVARIGRGDPPPAAVDATIHDFRALLEEGAHVDEAKLLGLLGELVVLRELVRRGGRAEEAWTGPFDQRHDFRHRLSALEVKASLRSDAVAVTISSIEQLLAPQGGSLVLAHVRLERAGRGSISVASLVQELTSMGVNLARLTAALKCLGCDDPYQEAFNKLLCELEGITWYCVSDGFPRLTTAELRSGQLPKGVTKLSYTLDLREAAGFALKDAELEKALSGLLP